MSPPDLRTFVDETKEPAGDPRDGAIADLQNELLAVNQRRNEERFLWVLTVVILLDFVFLLQSNNWSAPIVIGGLELIALVVLGEKCKVNVITQLIDRLSPIIGGRGGD